VKRSEFFGLLTVPMRVMVNSNTNQVSGVGC
jgi:hypothetical protein